MEESKVNPLEGNPVPKMGEKPHEFCEESKESIISKPKPLANPPSRQAKPDSQHPEQSPQPQDDKIAEMDLECIVTSFLQIPDQFLRKAIMHNKFGTLQLKSGKLDKAIRQFLDAKQLLSDLPVSTVLFQNLGNCYARQKNFKAAEAYYSAVVKYSPHSHFFPLETLDFLDIESRAMYTGTLNTREVFEDAQRNLSLKYADKEKDTPKKKEEAIQATLSKIDYGVSLREVSPSSL